MKDTKPKDKDILVLDVDEFLKGKNINVETDSTKDKEK